MTFAEILLIIGVGVGFYFLMRPLQRRLEVSFYKCFRSKTGGSNKPVIDITDYSKNSRNSQNSRQNETQNGKNSEKPSEKEKEKEK